MPKVVIEVPEWVDEEKVKLWIAEGMGRELFKKAALDALNSGIDISLKGALNEFGKTREETWTEIKEKYAKEGLIK